MIKKFYSDYVRHAVRFYSRNPMPTEFRCEADRKNWYACDTVLDKHFPRYKIVLISVYESHDTIGDSVYETAKMYNIPQDNLWKMMGDLEMLVAKERGLI